MTVDTEKRVIFGRLGGGEGREPPHLCGDTWPYITIISSRTLYSPATTLRLGLIVSSPGLLGVNKLGAVGCPAPVELLVRNRLQRQPLGLL